MQLTHKASFALALLTASSLAAVLPAQAQTPIVPVSYTETAPEGIAQGGGYNYFDETGKQLTDGILGVDNALADLGNGPAYEWVGWRSADPTINFDFGQNVNINSVSIGFNRNVFQNIDLPTDVTIDGNAFTVSPTALADDTRGFLTFNGNWTGSTLNVALADHDANAFIFVDEVKFTSPVPEASTTVSFGLLLCLGLGGLIWSARRKKAQAGE